MNKPTNNKIYMEKYIELDYKYISSIILDQPNESSSYNSESYFTIGLNTEVLDSLSGDNNSH